jgi:hypothetical protein
VTEERYDQDECTIAQRREIMFHLRSNSNSIIYKMVHALRDVIMLDHSLRTMMPLTN